MRKFLACLLLLSVSSFAQVNLPDAPSATLPKKESKTLQFSPNSNPKVIDRPFLIFTGIALAGAIADAEWGRRNVKFSNGCKEVNPFLPKFPSAGRYYGTTLGTWGGVTLATYFLKKHLMKKHSGAWAVLPVGESIVHFVGIKMTDSSCDGDHNFGGSL